jgi:hypothetical protein
MSHLFEIHEVFLNLETYSQTQPPVYAFTSCKLNLCKSYVGQCDEPVRLWFRLCILRSDALQPGIFRPTFRRSLLPPSLGRMSEEKGTFLRNVGKVLPDYTASHPRRRSIISTVTAVKTWNLA